MHYKAIIFDLDGTIIDTEWIWKKVTKDIVTSRGIAFDETVKHELENKLHGQAIALSCSILKKVFSIHDPVEKLIQEKMKRACALYNTHLTFIQGFEQFHKTVSAHKLKTGIATNSDEITLANAKRKLKLELFFGKHIYGIADVDNRSKPDPAIYLYAAKKLNVAPNTCIAIEDSSHGIHAAKKAGMFCIGINTANAYESIKHADIVVNSYNEINLDKLIHKNMDNKLI